MTIAPNRKGALVMLFASLPTIQHPDVHVRPIEAANIEVWARYLRDRRVYEHTSWNPTSSADLESYVWTAQSHSADSLLRLAIASLRIPKRATKFRTEKKALFDEALATIGVSANKKWFVVLAICASTPFIASAPLAAAIGVAGFWLALTDP